jgi:type IV secretion system protein VirB11
MSYCDAELDLVRIRLGFGKFQTDVSISDENAKRALYAVAYGIGDVCNESKPSISAELPGTGERFQRVLPALAESPLFVIRKKAAKVFTLDKLEQQGVVPPEGHSILREAVLSRRNILVVGGTDSGKTTFANALLQVVAETKDRIIILEDTKKLQCEAADAE